MTTTFTTLPGDKLNGSSPVVNATRRVSPYDLNKIFATIRELQTYLSVGNLDAAVTHTIGTANIATAAITAATITQATATHVDAIADQSPSVGPEIDWKGNRGRWFIGIDVANADTSRDFVLCGQRGTYTFSDGVTTSGSPTLTSAARGNFVVAQVGAAISGAGIPNGTTITAVGSLTSLTMSANATASASGVAVTITRNTAADIIYVAHRGGLSPTIGIGVTPPDGSARMQVSGSDLEPTMGGVRVRVGSSQTAKAFTIHDSAPTDKFWVDKDFYVSGSHSAGGAIALQGDVTNDRPLLLTNNAKSQFYGFSFPTGGGGVLRFVATTGANNVFQVGTDGTLFVYQPITIQLLMTLQSGLKGPGSAGAAPSTGTHARGEIYFNADPSAGGKIGWVCVTAGSPGTWKAWGAIDP